MITERLREIYTYLDATYGDELWHWDPAYVADPMDIIVGAMLVQHTTWTNAERALTALRGDDALDPGTIVAMPEERLIELIRVSGTPTVKAKRLRSLMRTMTDAGGLDAFLALPIDGLRPRLLATHGVGPETADAIALYASGHRTFVIDAYTRRLFGRIGVKPERAGYEDWRAFFQEALPDADVTFFQRYHAWIVLHGKAVCRPKPCRESCPLIELCAHGQRSKPSFTLPADDHPPTAAPAARTAR